AYSAAAAFPFLFLLTTNGVMVYNVANPTGNAPPMVTLTGLPFIPSALVASGRRIYLVADTQGEGPMYRQAVAWVDVPGDPFLTTLDATSAFIWTAQVFMQDAFIGDQGALDLVYQNSFDPIANLLPPITDQTMVVPAPIASLNANATVVAPSAPNFVAYRYAGRQPALTMISGVGQNSATAGAEQVLSTFGAVDNQDTFAAGGSGVVLWESAPLHLLADGGADGVASTRLTWLDPAADGGIYDTSLHADLEKYNAAAGIDVGPIASRGASLVGPVAWIDANTAVALAGTAEDPDSSSVQVFDRTRGSVVSGRRGVIPAPPYTLGVAASGGFAYVFAPTDENNGSASVYVVAPGCPGAGELPPDAGPGTDGGTPSSDGGRSGPHTGFTGL
ncbi:MAG TPA: hypothetical protein VHV30_11445, partial [Polyangiaceae bacterium]|nr:hypothetical protein [Polyangiaceae bacterium]